VDAPLSSLIAAADRGDRSAADALFDALYRELHRMAKRELVRKGLPISLSATTLLHQAYIEMASNDRTPFVDQGAFMGYAARVMRGLIIDYARRRFAQKRGGQFEITSLPQEIPDAMDPRQLGDISEALDQLAAAEPFLAQVVDLRFFCGFTFADIAAMQGISERTVQRQWEKARIYLRHLMKAGMEI
jgi:RNA polymerase sigma factor (TIGR02999 family)